MRGILFFIFASWWAIKGKLNIFNWVYWRSIGLSLTSVGLLGSMSPLNILPSTNRPWCTSRKRVFHQSVHCMVASMDWLHVGFYKRSSSIGCLYWFISTGLLVTNMFKYISGTTQSGWSICVPVLEHVSVVSECPAVCSEFCNLADCLCFCPFLHWGLPCSLPDWIAPILLTQY